MELMNEAEKVGTVRPVLADNGKRTVTFEDARQTLNLILSDVFGIQEDRWRTAVANFDTKMVALVSELSLSEEQLKKLDTIFTKINKGETLD